MSSHNRVITTDAEIKAAVAASISSPARHRALSATYLREIDKVGVRFDDDVDVLFPRLRLQGLENATSDQLENVTIEGPGTGLYWPDLDVSHYVPSLMDGVFGTRKWMSENGRKGGSQRSEAKAVAARENGKRGGRPRTEEAVNLLVKLKN